LQDVSPGEIVSGTPNISNQLHRRLFVIYKKLPEIYQMYKEWKREERRNEERGTRSKE
jgi:UDP-3-O-[3-hydroxymyristoyl] glucosamine N-acyltransferase